MEDDLDEETQDIPDNNEVEMSETDNAQGSGSGELKIADLPFTSRVSDTRGRGWCYFTMTLKVRFKS